MGVPTVTEVRDYLGGLSEDRLGNDTININIGSAQIDVDMAKSSRAPEDLVDTAYIVVTAYYAYRAYVAKLERTLGRIPAPAYNNLMLYKEDFDRFLEYVRRGTNPDGLITLATLRETQIDVAGISPDRLEGEE